MSKLKKITLIIVAVLVLAYLTLPHYVRQALIHQYPGIEDYKIFYNRVVEAGTYIPWEQDSLYNTMAIADSTMNKIESYEPVAFLVIQDEKILYEKYWEGYSDSSLSNFSTLLR
jgi:hypothetical protein